MLDVLVVGAGPAGSVAALVLARAGARVRLVDRAAFPRDKLCGDTLNPGALALLDTLGVGACVRPLGLAIRGMTVTGPGGARIDAAYPDGLSGIAITRRTLDAALVGAAVCAGATFDDGVVVQQPVCVDGMVAGVRVGGEALDVGARIVIAADGRASRLGQALRLTRFPAAPRRWAFGAYYSGVAGVAAHGEMHVRGDGYLGLVGVPGGLTNVCVVREVRPGGPRPGPACLIAEAIAADPCLRERFAGARQETAPVVLGPLAVEASAAGCPGLLLAGDAAGFIDPMTGDGLRFAIRGGMLAAEAALRELETGEAVHQHLHAARCREFSGKWRVNRALRRLSGSPRAVAVAARLARVWAWPVEQVVDLAGDVGLARASRACR